MPIPIQLPEVVTFLFHPWLFMANSIYYLPGTIRRLISQRDFRSLTSWPRLQAAWFGDFWAWVGPMVRQGSEPLVVPLLEGRVHHGLETEDRVGPPVSGVVIEVGAGSGIWVDIFAPRSVRRGAAGTATSTSGIDASGGATSRLGLGKITRVYGVEPNRGSHAELYQRVKDAGLEGTYEVVPVGIESLGDPSKWDGKIEKESVDCIVSVLCMCSIPDPEDNIRELYKYLKKGGRWYVFEHVRVDKYPGMRLYQCKSFLPVHPSCWESL